MEKILVVEDDPSILTGLSDLLLSEGYEVVRAIDGKEALELYTREKPSLILLDIMIPEKSGYDVCREIRKTDPVTPILMLTAKGEETDKVVGLELGADDYIVKPFGVKELLARIRAAYRYTRARNCPNGQPLRFGDVRINPKKMEGYKGKKRFSLSGRELHLLELFLSRRGEVLDRFTLLDEVWGIQYQGTTRTLDQHIAGLRRKIEDNPGKPRYILTVHGSGYRFAEDDDFEHSISPI